MFPHDEIEVTLFWEGYHIFGIRTTEVFFIPISVNHVRRYLMLIMLTGQHITGDVNVGHLSKIVMPGLAT